MVPAIQEWYMERIDFRIESKLNPSTSDKQVFENLQLFTSTGIAKNGTTLFFGKHPEIMFPMQ